MSKALKRASADPCALSREPIPEKIRRAPPCLDQLPVDHGRADAQFRQSRANRRRAARPVAAAGGEQARLAAVERRDGTAAAMHGLMPPLRPSRRPSDGLGKRGRKKDGRNTSKADLAQAQASRQFRTGSGLFKIHRCRAKSRAPHRALCPCGASPREAAFHILIPGDMPR